MAIPIHTPDFSPSDPSDPNAPHVHVVLVQPEIPPNTGSVARLCAATNTWLHLVEPLGYELDDRHLKRAGLDYWPKVRLSVHPSLEALTSLLPWERTWIFSKKAQKVHTDIIYPRDTVLLFGRESAGLPEDFMEQYQARALRIPTTDNVRSLNLSQAAAITVYEIVRQQGLFR